MRIFLDDLSCGKAAGYTYLCGVVLDKVGYRVNASMYSSALAEVNTGRLYFLFSHLDSLTYAIVNTFVFSRAYRDNGNTELIREQIYVDSAAVFSHLVHHIEREHHRDLHFEKLKSEIKVSFDIRSVNYIDYSVGALVENKISCKYLLVCVGADRVYTGKVYDRDVFNSAYLTYLCVDRDSGEVSYVAVSSGEAVEKSGLTAILIAY